MTTPDFERQNSNLRYDIERLNLDCGDTSCRYAKNKGGMRTNGGCRCKRNIEENKKLNELSYQNKYVLKEGLADRIFQYVAHGDIQHREWLKRELHKIIGMV